LSLGESRKTTGKARVGSSSWPSLVVPDHVKKEGALGPGREIVVAIGGGEVLI
jgi:hypothetical protein